MKRYALKRFFDQLKHRKLHASSIVEVIVALAICLIIFMISMSVILNSQRSNNIRLKQKAQFVLSAIDANNLPENASFDKGSLQLEKNIQENDTIPGVSVISYSIYDNAGHKLAMKVFWLATENLSGIDVSDGIMDRNL